MNNDYSKNIECFDKFDQEQATILINLPAIKENVAQLFIFGSVARGTNEIESDLDILIKPKIVSREVYDQITKAIKGTLDCRTDIIFETSLSQYFTVMIDNINKDKVRIM